jgi:H2-forming N5,N10-methylenetetrahydromethanopterin dehydrogenase-like enzyme
LYLIFLRKAIPHQRPPKFNPEQFQREVENMKVEDILKEFDKQFKRVEENNQLDQQEKKIVKKLRALDRSALRSKVRSALTDEEVKIFFILLLKILSGEIG